MRSTFQQPTLQLLRVEDDKRLVSHLVFNTGQDWSQSNGRQGQITFTIKTEPITSEVLEQVPESMSAEVLVHHPANCPLDLMMENVTLGDLLRSEIPDTQLINFGAPMRYVKCNLPSENAGVLGFAFVDGSGREHRVNARPIEMEFVTPGPVWADTQSILAAIEERRLPESVARGLQQVSGIYSISQFADSVVSSHPQALTTGRKTRMTTKTVCDAGSRWTV